MKRCVLLIFLLLSAQAALASDVPAPLDAQFPRQVRPFLQQYCVTCHGHENPEADLNLETYSSMTQAARDSGRWDLIIEKLDAAKMPPKKAKARPSDEARRQVAAWFHQAREDLATRNAGDPGIALARRLSNDEFDYSIRDLTGVDIRPAKEFPVDPANTAGFDNSGESLTMSPSLLNKYLQAARQVASYLVLEPEGFAFAPYPILGDPDRDKYCVQQIINFYRAQDTDYADYFEAAWRYKHRAALGRSRTSLAEIAAERKVSPKYLATVYAALEDEHVEIGPLARLQAMWRQLPAPDAKQPEVARPGCRQMRDFVIQLRKKVEMRFLNLSAGNVATNLEPLLIGKNVQYATHRMAFDPAQLQVEGEEPHAASDAPEPGVKSEFGPGRTILINNPPGDPDLAVPVGQRARYEAAFARFCRVFPDRFFMQERGRNYFDTTTDRGRYLSAGFHNLMGYFRDDQPLYELILSDDQQKHLDAMWRDLDFVASASRRTYIQFCSTGQRGERSIEQTEARGNGNANDTDVTSEARIRQLEQGYLSRAEGGDPRGIEAIKYYFDWMNDHIRWTEKARIEAEPSHLESLRQFAERAYRRPLTKKETDDVIASYKAARQAGLDHESAIKEGIVVVLMSPDFCYRIDLLPPGVAQPGNETTKAIVPLTDYELASRLSYFLWSSLPDEKLLAHARDGDLHDPAVLSAEARRMLRDDRAAALAVEFGGSWLDFRRFDEIATVDRDRFPEFTSELRRAMYEEPIRFLTDAFASDRSMLDLVYGRYTFVNPVLARHYGIPIPEVGSDQWLRVDDADRYGRGGILPMAAFLTKNAPGLRTSPVKRGNWVVKNVLGEKIPAPPPNVPQLPHDEAKLDLPLREMLARHRADANCAACHARIDPFGLVFEEFGPVGEHRDKDLAGRDVDASAVFPDGTHADGLAGLQAYLREHRQNDFVDNFSRKLLAYALGRSLMISDDLLIRRIHDKLAADGYHPVALVQCIVTSPQFLNKRCREEAAAATERRTP